jgi:hypothetical protein
MTPLNKAQRQALKKVYDRTKVIDPVTQTEMSYREFRKTVTFGPGCVMVPWCGMWLGIEPDGYTHS